MVLKVLEREAGRCNLWKAQPTRKWSSASFRAGSDKGMVVPALMEKAAGSHLFCGKR